jgi:hypothetical protein
MNKDEALTVALENICAAKLCEFNSMSSRHEQMRLMDVAITVMKEGLAQPDEEKETLKRCLFQAQNAAIDLAKRIEELSLLVTSQGIRLMEYESNQEPVAYGVLDEDGQIDWTCDYPFSNDPGWPDSVPLYTSPPHRQPLSDGWILGMWPDTGFPHLVLKFARAIESAHGIKEAA